MKSGESLPVDLIVRGVRAPALGPGNWDAAVLNGVFSAFARGLRVSAKREIDGTGFLLLPGAIDAHLHLNEPGRTSWEGIATGTRALAAGGVTSFFDMPLNSSPPCTTAEALWAKRGLMQKKSLIDFALWGGLIPGNAGKMPELARAGAVGVKAFLCPSGLDEFPASDEKTLLTGAKACARHGLVLAVHAEHPGVLAAAAGAAAGQGLDEIEYFLRSRPPLAEEEAIAMCLRVAAATGCRFHIVHTTTTTGLKMIRRAVRKGARVTAETCPHYLLLDPEKLRTLGGRAKCAPPLRPAAQRAALWRAVSAGLVDTIGSDHSPCPPALKERSSFSRQWGGISGGQHGNALFLSAARQHRISWGRIDSLLAGKAAAIFGLPGKGRLQTGADADFVLWQKIPPREITSEELLTRHPLSPYVGSVVDWEPAMTFVRGRAVQSGGHCARAGQAREIKRTPL